MSASDMLSHAPTSSWKCYSKEGDIGAGNSNLSLWVHSSMALTGQMEDNGSGNYSVGHRRWILNPFKKIYGHGSTNAAMSLWTLGGYNVNKELGDINLYYNDSVMDLYDIDFISWPPKDFVIDELAFRRWSFSLAQGNFEEAEIYMSCNGSKINLEIEPLNQGYGLNSIVWIPDINIFDYINKKISICIKKVYQGYNQEKLEFKYDVMIIDN